jgi:CRP-like cAMP-binding protein
VAAVNSTVLHLPGDVLRRMAMTIPALAIGIIEGLSFKGQCYSALAQMLGTRSPTERLAQLLLHLMNLYGVEERDGALIAASFTHADLAHMTGVTRQSVTISLKRFTELGILACAWLQPRDQECGHAERYQGWQARQGRRHGRGLRTGGRPQVRVKPPLKLCR